MAPIRGPSWPDSAFTHLTIGEDRILTNVGLPQISSSQLAGWYHGPAVGHSLCRGGHVYRSSLSASHVGRWFSRTLRASVRLHRRILELRQTGSGIVPRMRLPTPTTREPDTGDHWNGEPRRPTKRSRRSNRWSAAPSTTVGGSSTGRFRRRSPEVQDVNAGTLHDRDAAAAGQEHREIAAIAGVALATKSIPCRTAGPGTSASGSGESRASTSSCLSCRRRPWPIEAALSSVSRGVHLFSISSAAAWCRPQGHDLRPRKRLQVTVLHEADETTECQSAVAV
jgi:hypothetical protein